MVTKKPAHGGFLYSRSGLDCHYVNSRRAFLTVLDFELYALAFSQSFEAVTLDCREVYKHVFAAVSRSNETKTFRLVEPLNLTFNLCHLEYFLWIVLTALRLYIDKLESLLLEALR